jgi:hypothetical protein
MFRLIPTHELPPTNETLRLIERCLSSRLINEERLSDVPYEGFSSAVRSFCRIYETSPPILIVTYSNFRRSEYLNVDGTTVLIHDQYLGQSLNHLNTITALETVRKESLKVYGSKMIAEHFRSLGLEREAKLHAYSYYISSGASRDLLSDAMLGEDRMWHTFIQERYILAHELAHLFVDQHREDLRNSMAEISEYIADSVWLKAADPMSIGSPPFSEQEEQLLIDEILCDSFATNFVVGTLEAQRVPRHLAIESIWRVQLYLWWLDCIKKCVEAYSEGRDFSMFASIGMKLRHSRSQFHAYGVLTEGHSLEKRYEIAAAATERFAELRELYFDPLVDVAESLHSEIYRPQGYDDYLSLEHTVLERTDLGERAHRRAPDGPPSWYDYVDAATGWIT